MTFTYNEQNSTLDFSSIIKHPPLNYTIFTKSKLIDDKLVIEKLSIDKN